MSGRSAAARVESLLGSTGSSLRGWRLALGAALLPLLAEADFVAGVRAERHDSALRKWMSRTANRVRARFLRDGLRDSGCALKAFRREVLDAFLPIRTLYSFMPALAVGAGFRVVEAEVRHRERERGASKYGLRVMLWRPAVDMLGVKWFLARRIPARPALREAPRPKGADAPAYREARS